MIFIEDLLSGISKRMGTRGNVSPTVDSEPAKRAIFVHNQANAAGKI